MDEAIRRYYEVFEVLIERSGLPKRVIEHQMGWARGTLTKILRGRQKLTITDVLALLKVLEVEPLVFYTLVHSPDEPGTETVVDAVFRTLGPGVRPLVLSRFLTDTDLDRLVEEAVGRVLARQQTAD